MYSPPFIVFAVIIMMVYIGTIASVIWQTLQIRKQENSLFRIGLSLFGLLAMGVHSTMYLYMIVTVLDDKEQSKSAWPYYLLLPASIIASIAQCQISLGRYLVAIVNKATRDKIYHRMALVNGLVCLACVGISVFDVIRDSAKGKIPPYSIGFSLALVYCPIHGLIFGILFFSRAMRQIIVIDGPWTMPRSLATITTTRVSIMLQPPATITVPPTFTVPLLTLTLTKANLTHMKSSTSTIMSLLGL
jgi:hypothetical protein